MRRTTTDFNRVTYANELSGARLTQILRLRLNVEACWRLILERCEVLG
jgi:hypothetical protein